MENEELFGQEPDLDDALDGAEEKAGRKKTVLVPRVQNMDNYLMAHYKRDVLQALNRRLADGEISEIVGRPVRSERIESGDCCFRHFSYWRLNQCDLLIDVEMRLQLLVETEAGVDTDFFAFYVELWFSFCGEEEACELESLGLLEHRPEHDGAWKLDKYLVPVLRRDEIDQYAEDMWRKYCPEAAENAKLRRPRDLAEKMGLSVVSVPMKGRGDTRSVLFFRDASVTAQDPRIPGEREDPPPYEAKIRAGTIVINCNHSVGSGFDLDIYHECIHYEWHYLFYRLQDLHSNDVKRMPMVRRSAAGGQDPANPVRFMEYQARYGSFGLMMPRSFMVKTVQRLYQEACNGKRKDGLFDHDGRRYDFVARRIAGDCGLQKARVRARMLQLGYAGAVGALNYVDGRYITPFAVSDIGKCRGNETYVIDRKNISALYRKDPDFQRIMRSGRFAYVDGHVVYLESDNVLQTEEGARLTAWANAHVDRVSLRFTRVYSGEHRYTYAFGRMNSTDEVDRAFEFLDVGGKLTLKERQAAADRCAEELPGSFHGALAYLMKVGHCSVEGLLERVPISRSTLIRLRTEERKQYDLDLVVALCVGLHLPPWMSELLLERARLSVKRTGPYGYYGMILDCFYMDRLEDVKQFLEDNEYPPLNLHFDGAESA